ncbi:hypothetical protein [Saccharothrix syringae]|uniref:hypothetical protein n=1 Tax=Saccharothrix syringae TaxID=103733 RepID=UPI0005254AC9|nr:hypothetical protein [Saccharothrix syringae]
MAEQSAPEAREYQGSADQSAGIDPEREIRELTELVYYSDNLAGNLKSRAEDLKAALAKLQKERQEIAKQHGEYVKGKYNAKLREILSSVKCSLPDYRLALGEKADDADRLIEELKAEIGQARKDLAAARNSLDQKKGEVKKLAEALKERQDEFDDSIKLSATLTVKHKYLKGLADGIAGSVNNKPPFEVYATAVEIVRQFDEAEVRVPFPGDYLDDLMKKWAAVVAARKALTTASAQEADLQGKVQQYDKLLKEDLTKDRIAVLLRRWQQQTKDEVPQVDPEAQSDEEVSEWGAVTSL